MLRSVDVLRELGDDIDEHDVLAGQPLSMRPLEGRGKEHIVGHLRVLGLGRAIGRDRVQDVGELACYETGVVGVGVPGEHLGSHRLVVELRHVVHGVDRLGRIEHDLPVLVLHRPPVGPDERTGCHVGVELVRHADAHAHVELVLDGLAAGQ